MLLTPGSPDETITIIIVIRDRFSTTKKCLEIIIENTPEPCRIIAVFGGVPGKIRADLTNRFLGKVEFIFEDRFLNPSESRNIGLKACKTRMAAIVENDVYVTKNWLKPLLRCFHETHSSMVVPLVLHMDNTIHAAGTSLFITHKDGKAYGQKEIRYYDLTVYAGTNLKREPVDYGELHCQLVDVDTALRLSVYDEKLLEAAEVDSGLTWVKAGCGMWFEPGSSVAYDFPDKISAIEDIKPFIFKWDMRQIKKSYDYFNKKWSIDITECGRWKLFNLYLNNKLGFFSRYLPSKLSLMVDNFLYRMRKLCKSPLVPWRALKAWLCGYFEWK